jgi:hypothetical protein
MFIQYRAFSLLSKIKDIFGKEQRALLKPYETTLKLNVARFFQGSEEEVRVNVDFFNSLIELVTEDKITDCCLLELMENRGAHYLSKYIGILAIYFFTIDKNITRLRTSLSLCRELLFFRFLEGYAYSSNAEYDAQKKQYPDDLIHRAYETSPNLRHPIERAKIRELFLLTKFGVISPLTAVLYLYYSVKPLSCVLPSEFTEKFFQRAVSPIIWIEVPGADTSLLQQLPVFPEDILPQLKMIKIAGGRSALILDYANIDKLMTQPSVSAILQLPEIKNLTPRVPAASDLSQQTNREQDFCCVVATEYERSSHYIECYRRHIRALCIDQITTDSFKHPMYMRKEACSDIAARFYLAFKAGVSLVETFAVSSGVFFICFLLRLAERLSPTLVNPDVRNFIMRLMRCLNEDILDNRHGNEHDLCSPMIGVTEKYRAQRMCAVWAFCFAILDPTWDRDKCIFLRFLLPLDFQTKIINYLRHGRIHSPGLLSWVNWRPNFSSYINLCCDEFERYRDIRWDQATPPATTIDIPETFRQGKLVNKGQPPMLPIISQPVGGAAAASRVIPFSAPDAAAASHPVMSPPLEEVSVMRESAGQPLSSDLTGNYGETEGTFFLYPLSSPSAGALPSTNPGDTGYAERTF